MVLARRRSADRVRVVVGLGKRETQSGRVELGKSRKTHTHRQFVMPHHAVVSLVRRRRVQGRDKLNGTISSHDERRGPNSTSGVDIDKQVVARLFKYVLYNQNYLQKCHDGGLEPPRRAVRRSVHEVDGDNSVVRRSHEHPGALEDGVGSLKHRFRADFLMGAPQKQWQETME